ncbi:centrosomal protein of 135 kDa [Musca vetustissima]|uniref:centrosomal protein of 135 kDa n=1 Tax=Musca vetustissima TaxID=27455 RepID=UPI002AB74EBC|nr:centrosomal protein of 135 kDa [Musca vetustissima]
MSATDSVFNNLRQKLNVLGYHQTLPLSAIPLVGCLFDDLVKTTESLRDSKKQIMELLEEKSCWELGVEPYKCDNARLLQQNNQLHMQTVQQQEDYEDKIRELNTLVRDLQSDKFHLQQQVEQLQQQLKLQTLQYRTATTSAGGNMKYGKEGKAKKPFITAVRSGDPLPSLQPLQEHNSNLRCTKCNLLGYNQKNDGATQTKSQQKELEKLENANRDLIENLKFYQKKIESRDREISRLNDLLSGGRPPAALARDCCYKNIGNITEDLDMLQREKMDCLTRMREFQDQMHEAMQRALDLENTNRSLQSQLDELKEAALLVETEANNEISQRENEIEMLKMQLKQMQGGGGKHKPGEKKAPDDGKKQKHAVHGDGGGGMAMDNKHRYNEKINELTQRETELKMENEHLQKKVTKLKSKLQSLQKEFKETESQHAQNLDEEKIRLKSERDFFQKEYLRLLSKAGSDKEIEFLQSQIKSKDEELRLLRLELCTRPSTTAPNALVPCYKDPENHHHLNLPTSARSGISTATSGSSSSDCVQAAILRIERERDCARSEMERLKCERDTLREKLLCTTKMHDEQMHKTQERFEELNSRLRQLEREKRELQSARMPTETQIIMLKEEIEAYKQQQFQLREENNKLQSNYNQLKILHEQTERTLGDYQNKLLYAEQQLETTNRRVNTLDTNRDSVREEALQLRSEVKVLKQTYAALENEKDKILTQLDAKTEKVYQLEYELKASKEKRNALEKQVSELEEKLSKLSTQSRERSTELHETSTESKSLRQQLTALKTSRDQAIQENVRLSNDLAESQAEVSSLRKQLKDSEKEIERLKQQLRKYVEEVKKAEDLLMHKEKEREEMLEHYRSLSHDAVMLEGNNQSLENETAEYRRQVAELDAEISTLKKELNCRNKLITELEDRIATLTAKNTCLEHQLGECQDEQRILKTDLEARKELCDKLDNEKDKLNAELNELNDVKRKLEMENERLRFDLDKTEKGKQMSAETLEELLTKTRRDLEEQIKVDSKLSQELVQLRKQNDELLHDLELERQKREQNATLAREFQVQNQELRHNLTDDRFRQARSREQSPRYPPVQTL